MAIEIANLGFQLNPLPTFSPVFVPRTVLKSSKRCRFDRRNLLLLRPPASSLVDEQPQVSFTEPENRLIDSLVGIQGRGRSASPQQLSVCCFWIWWFGCGFGVIEFVFYLFIYIFYAVMLDEKMVEN